MAYIVRPSTNPGKKWMVTLPTGRVVHFGAAGYDDYTTHGDVRRRRNYIMRHAPNEDWALSGVTTAGFWSRWMLWQSPNLADAVADLRRRLAPANVEFHD